jgi:hypothetical protein
LGKRGINKLVLEGGVQYLPNLLFLAMYTLFPTKLIYLSFRQQLFEMK